MGRNPHIKRSWLKQNQQKKQWRKPATASPRELSSMSLEELKEMEASIHLYLPDEQRKILVELARRG